MSWAFEPSRNFPAAVRRLMPMTIRSASKSPCGENEVLGRVVAAYVVVDGVRDALGIEPGADLRQLLVRREDLVTVLSRTTVERVHDDEVGAAQPSLLDGDFQRGTAAIGGDVPDYDTHG
jgi:hypothetical protein